MGIFTDYINSLEGNNNITIEGVVADLARLHDEEIGGVNDLLTSANAKIESQNTELAASIEKLTEAQAETSRVKVANYDLIMSQGITDNNNADLEDRIVDESNITPDDMFAPSEV
jgi:hypothetical protein